MTAGGGIEMALGAMRDRRPDLAIAMLEPLSRRVGCEARVWQLLGFAYRDEQRMPEAVRSFARAVELAPQDAKSAIAHAQACFESGLPAADLCRHALDLAPTDLAAIGSCAAALAAEGGRSAAESLLHDALREHPAWLEGHKALATLRFTAGDRSGFADSYADACRRLPRHLPLRLAWFRSVAQTRDWSAAGAILDAGERECGPQRAFVVARLFIAAESGARAAAVALFEQTRGWRDDVRDLAWLRHCLREGRPEDAATAALELTQTPSARLAWPYLSLIWRLLGDARAAWLDAAPGLVRVTQLDLGPQEWAELAALLRSLHTASAPYLDQSVRGGTQTDRPLFFRCEPIVQRLRDCVLAAVRDYVAGLPPPLAGHPLLGTPREHLWFSGSWSVRLGAGGHNVAHTHPLGWISSALYVALPAAPKMGPAPNGWLRFGEPPAELRLDLPAYSGVEPRIGRLVLFPSTLWHATVPIAGGERLAVAFDMGVPRR